MNEENVLKQPKKPL